MFGLDLKRSVFIPGLLFFVILFLINGISKNQFKRFDLTDNKKYSLSSSSRSVIEQIDDLLTMKVYFSDDLPGQYANNRRYLQDILEEYAAFSNGNIRFEFFRPEDDQNVEQEAQKAGIMPVQMQVIENDKMEVKRVLMGMVILFEDNKETLPVIQTTTGLEYEITTKIKKLVDQNKPVLGLVSVEGQTTPMQNIQNALNQRFDVRPLNLSEEVPPTINALLMGSVSDSLKSEEFNNLSSYLERGGSLFLSQSRIKTNLQVQQALPIQSNIFSLLNAYGLDLQSNLVTDQICGRVNVQQQMGPIRMNVPIEYPLLPVIRNFNADESIVAGLEQMQLIFASEIKQDSASMGSVNFQPLFYTSDNSGELRGNFNLNPDPQQNPFMRIFNKSKLILGARSEKKNSNGSVSQVILVGDSEFISDEGGGRSPENQIFVLNSIDYLIGDKDLIALRSREITSRPLAEIEDSSRKTWKWFNIIAPTFLIVGFGFLRLRNQKSKSSNLEEIYG